MGLWNAPALLNRFEKLRSAGFAPPLSVGMRIARGFADLGYEEFLIIAEGKLLSLFTGKQTELPADDVHRFFPVLNADELVDELLRRGAEIQSLVLRDQRAWELTIRSPDSDEIKQFTDPALDAVLADALLGEMKGGEER